MPTIVSVPALTKNMKFKIGITKIRIGSTDLTGNTVKCIFTVKVIGNYLSFVSANFVKHLENKAKKE